MDYSKLKSGTDIRGVAVERRPFWCGPSAIWARMPLP